MTANVESIIAVLTSKIKYYIDLDTNECVCKYHDEFDDNKIDQYLEIPYVDTKSIKLKFIKHYKLSKLLKKSGDKKFETMFYNYIEDCNLLEKWYKYEHDILEQYVIEWCITNNIEFDLYYK